MFLAPSIARVSLFRKIQTNTRNKLRLFERLINSAGKITHNILEIKDADQQLGAAGVLHPLLGAADVKSVSIVTSLHIPISA